MAHLSCFYAALQLISFGWLCDVTGMQMKGLSWCFHRVTRWQWIGVISSISPSLKSVLPIICISLVDIGASNFHNGFILPSNLWVFKHKMNAFAPMSTNSTDSKIIGESERSFLRTTNVHLAQFSHSHVQNVVWQTENVGNVLVTDNSTMAVVFEAGGKDYRDHRSA